VNIKLRLFYSLCIFISAIIAILRVAGVSHEVYQAIAHVWIGMLIGGWICLFHWPIAYDDEVDEFFVMCVVSVILLSLVEVSCFLFFKFF
jgi:hypothetical protein